MIEDKHMKIGGKHHELVRSRGVTKDQWNEVKQKHLDEGAESVEFIPQPEYGGVKGKKLYNIYVRRGDTDEKIGNKVKVDKEKYGKRKVKDMNKPEPPKEQLPDKKQILPLLTKLPSGNWIKVTEEKVDRYIDNILKREVWFAPRKGRDPMTTKEEVIEFLKTGDPLNYGDDWYAVLKMDIPKIPVTPVVKLVKCSCGHTVPSTSVMSTSRGTSCPACYDKMDL